MALGESPPLNDSIWFRVEGEAPTEWVRAHVTGITRAKSGERRVGMVFAEFCPESIFALAIWGEGVQKKASGSLRLAAPPSILRSSVPAARGPAYRTTLVLGPSSAPSKGIARSEPMLSASVGGETISLSRATERQRGIPRRSVSVRAWIFPLLLHFSLAVLIVSLAFMTLADVCTLDALVESLPRD